MKAISGIENAPVFCPVVAPFYSGMEVTVPIFKSMLKDGTTLDDIKNIYKAPIYRIIDKDLINLKYNNIKIYLGNLDLYIDGKVLTYDEKVDLALIEVETSVLLKPCELGSDSEIKKGKFCIAVGSPYDLEVYYNTVTVGNISSTKRVINESNYFYKEISNEYIQTTATINEGCSGGGLFNLKGELIGINTWKLVDSSTNIDGMNFAVSVDKIKELFSHYLH